MSEVITANLLAEGYEYSPRVGQQYELAPGAICTLKPPTKGLQEAAQAKGEEEGVTDFDLARLVLEGAEEVAPEDQIYGMAAKAVQDFFTVVLLITGALTRSSAASAEALKEAQGRVSSLGQLNGGDEPTLGT